MIRVIGACALVLAAATTGVGSRDPSHAAAGCGPNVSPGSACSGQVSLRARPAPAAGPGDTSIAGMPDDVNAAVSCVFSASPPQRSVLGSGAPVATASVKPVSCRGGASPSRSTVCLAPPGSNGSCTTDYGWNTAQITYAPAPAGATFTVTGEGCWTAPQYSDDGCASVAAVSGTP
jgi:hypothetical protein